MKIASLLTKRGMASLAMIFTVAGVSLPSVASASIITFDFTGYLTVSGNNPSCVDGSCIVSNTSASTPSDRAGYRTPVSASLVWDTNGGISSSTLSITMANFWGSPAVIHDIVPVSQSGNLLTATLLVDWYKNPPNLNMPAAIVWDATGLINANSYGLQVGDKISGNSLLRPDGNGGYTTISSNLGSAQPYSDTLLSNCYTNQYCAYLPALQNYAPLAATAATPGFTSGPFVGIGLYLDIGSGNSMDVTSVSSVPAPAAVWLLGSGLAGLFGIAKRRKG